MFLREADRAYVKGVTFSRKLYGVPRASQLTYGSMSSQVAAIVVIALSRFAEKIQVPGRARPSILAGEGRTKK